MYIIVIAIVAVGAWLFMRKGNGGTASLYDASPSATPSQEASVSATPASSVAPAGPVVKTASGLQYQDEVVGTGSVAKTGQMVSVQYTGTLVSGKKFDSSYDRNEPFSFQLGSGQVIKGWDEGVAGMKVGGKRKLIIPPTLGYGSQDVGNGLIPANSTLIFEVEVVGVK